jgi:DNA-binding response OmpR family regulator
MVRRFSELLPSRGKLPVKERPLPSAIARLVSIEAPANANAITSKPTPIINDEQFTMDWNGKTYAFKNTKEFGLLAVLARRFEKWVSVRRLVEAVWKDDLTDRHTVQRTVANLRQRLQRLGITDLAIDGSNPGNYRLYSSS